MSSTLKIQAHAHTLIGFSFKAILVYTRHCLLESMYDVVFIF